MNRDTTDAIADAWSRELPGVIGDELQLAKRAGRLAVLLNERVEPALGRLGLTKAEYEVLAVLRATGEPYRLRPSDVTQRLMLSSGGTSNLLRRLAAADLIEREDNPDDARSSWVRLSPRGVKTAEEAVRAAAAAQAKVLEAVPQPTRRAAIKALRALLIALGDTA